MDEWAAAGSAERTVGSLQNHAVEPAANGVVTHHEFTRIFLYNSIARCIGRGMFSWAPCLPMLTEPKSPIILLVEDSDDDAFFFSRTLGKSQMSCVLRHVTDGAQAIA